MNEHSFATLVAVLLTIVGVGLIGSVTDIRTDLVCALAKQIMR